MKHLLNDISDFEKNRILEQYENSLVVETNNFRKLIGSKLGSVMPILNENKSIWDWELYHKIKGIKSTISSKIKKYE